MLVLAGLGLDCPGIYTAGAVPTPELQLVTPTMSLTAKTKPPTLGRCEDAPSLTVAAGRGGKLPARAHHQQMLGHLPPKLQRVPILPFISPNMSQFLSSLLS